MLAQLFSAACLLNTLAAADTKLPPPARTEKSDPAVLVADLRDDDIPFNAERARWLLVQIGKAAIPALEEGVRSSDYQQRQESAAILREIEGYEPTNDMLRVCVEGLRDDRGTPLIKVHSQETAIDKNAIEGTEFLLKHVALMEAELASGLESDDEQQRFLCAVIFGLSHMIAYAPRAMDPLLAHIRDNDIVGDGIVAGAALYGFGDKIRPFLLLDRDATDDQGRVIIDHIIALFDQGPTNEEWPARTYRLPTISRSYSNPIEDFKFTGSCQMYLPSARDYYEGEPPKPLPEPRAGICGGLYP